MRLFYRLKHTTIKKSAFRLSIVALSICLTFCIFVCTGCSAASSLSGSAKTSTTEDTTEEKNIVNMNQLPDSSFLYDAEISDLNQADTFYDEQTVQIKGEVVGDRIASEDEADNYWITIEEIGKDNPSVISVLMNEAQTELIDTYGNYSLKGTTLQVRGTYHLVCSNHQGQSDIHASEVSVVEKGTTVNHEISSVFSSAGVLSVLMGVALLFAYRYLRERER